MQHLLENGKYEILLCNTSISSSKVAFYILFISKSLQTPVFSNQEQCVRNLYKALLNFQQGFGRFVWGFKLSFRFSLGIFLKHYTGSANWYFKQAASRLQLASIM